MLYDPDVVFDRQQLRTDFAYILGIFGHFILFRKI